MITIALLVCLIGLILWAIAANAEFRSNGFVSELGRLSFFAGLLAYLLNIGMKTL